MMCLLLACCTSEEMIDGSSPAIGKNSVAFTFRSQNRLAETADAYNETSVKTVNVFFCEPDNEVISYMQLGVQVNSGGVAVIPIDNDMVGKTWQIYAIANQDVSGWGIREGTTSVSDLKAHTIETAFKTDGKPEDAFVMDGTLESVALETEKVNGEIKLQRAASRIQLYANVKSFTDEETGVNYEPNISDMKVTFRRAVKRTNLAGTYGIKTDDYLEGVSRTFDRTFLKPEGLEQTSYRYHALPFYSYANDWTDNEADTESYLEVSIIWLWTDEGTTESGTYYYSVPVSEDESLKPNHAYNVWVDISMLGSETEENPVKLEGTYEVIDWINITFDAGIDRYRYLVLDHYRDTLNNEVETDFKYTSSSPVSVTIERVEWNNYSTKDNEEVTWKANDEDNNIANNGFKALVIGKEIHFEHPMADDLFYPYTIYLKVSNQDGEEKEAVITQYPAIYVTAEDHENNPTNVFIFGESEVGEEVFLDPTGSIGGNDKKMSVGKLVSLGQGGSDDNPNQYNIYVTALDGSESMSDGRKYMIGDPREKNGRAIYETIPEVTSYKGTKEEPEAQSIIAPIYKIASSWGGMGSLLWINGGSFNAAKNRCAVYQENGYPAGRWRVPTEAEIEYIVNLSEVKKVIPRLFNTSEDGGDYYAASGRLWTKNEWASTGYTLFVRCVYDVWYWGDKKIDETSSFSNSQFVWGDKDTGELTEKR